MRLASSRRMRYALLYSIALLGLGHFQGAQAAGGADPAINRAFQRPNFSEWTGRLEGESREIYARREEIADATGVQNGMQVADVGAGTGFMTMLFARRVGPGGLVTAVDVSPTFIEAIRERAAREGLRNVWTTLGTQTDTHLPEESVDIVFTSDTYHHFEEVKPVLASIRRALRSGGRFIVVDFERNASSPESRMKHVRAGKETVIQEVEGAGFQFRQEVTSLRLRDNYFLIFEKK